MSEQNAKAVVNEITQGSRVWNSRTVVIADDGSLAGGKATAAVCSAEDGEALVKAALDTFGGVHILVANAGILRDKSFATMAEQEWDAVIAVHLRYCVVQSFCISSIADTNLGALTRSVVRYKQTQSNHLTRL